MANPALLQGLPDVEALLHTTLAERTVTVSSFGLEWPWPHRLSIHDVRIVTRAASKQTCSDEAWSVHAAVIALRGKRWEDGLLADVEVLQGPAWLPDPDGRPAYAADYRLFAHPLGASP